MMLCRPVNEKMTESELMSTVVFSVRNHIMSEDFIYNIFFCKQNNNKNNNINNKLGDFLLKKLEFRL